MTSVIAPPAPAQGKTRGAVFTACSGDAKADLSNLANIHYAFAVAIGASTRTLDVAMYRLDEPVVVKALCDAPKRGVAVRVLTDDDSRELRFKEAFDQLQAAGIEVVVDSKNPVDWAVHHKFAIADGRFLWTGDWNASVADTVRARHGALWVDSAGLAAQYEAEFDRLWKRPDWARTPVARAPVDRPWASLANGGRARAWFGNSEHIAVAAVAAIESAERSIDIAHTEFRCWAVADALSRALLRGVRVRCVYVNTSTDMRYPSTVRRFGGQMRQARARPGEFVGSKYILIDDDTVVTGSWNLFNYTANAENLVRLEGVPDLVTAYRADFEDQFAKAPRFWTSPTSSAASPESITRSALVAALAEGGRLPDQNPTADGAWGDRHEFTPEAESARSPLRAVSLHARIDAATPRSMIARLTLGAAAPGPDPGSPVRGVRVVAYPTILASAQGPYLTPDVRPVVLEGKALEHASKGLTIPYRFSLPVKGTYKIEVDLLETDGKGRVVGWLSTFKARETWSVR